VCVVFSNLQTEYDRQFQVIILPNRFPPLNESFSGKFAHRWGLQQFGDTKAGYLVQSYLYVAEEFHHSFDADRVGVFLWCI
jgi:hypothetical protein